MPEEDILHQDDVEAVIEEVIEETVGLTQPAIADVGTPGAVYAEAEAVAVADKVNDILAVLRTAGIIEAE